MNVYDVLIAPSGPRNAGGDSPSKTTGVYQPFYFGNMSGCYGGAWIIGLTASDSKCDTFAEWFDPESENYVVDQSFWYHPVYGVMLQRWLDMSPVANQPWTGELGWPVYGPTAYANGTLQLNAKGAYYQWGMWFERGFIWWVDYDQVTSPTVPDEAQVYRFTGDNVYCYGEDDALIEVAPKMFYGAAGPLGVAVTVDAYRNETTDDWSPVEQNDRGRGNLRRSGCGARVRRRPPRPKPPAPAGRSCARTPSLRSTAHRRPSTGCRAGGRRRPIPR